MKIILCILLTLSSCLYAKEVKKREIPLSKVFWSLYQEKNILGHNDCTNKCGRYLRALVGKGHNAEILIIMPHRTRFLHAIIKVLVGEKVTYLDPTRGIISENLDSFGFLQQTIQHRQLAQLGSSYK